MKELKKHDEFAFKLIAAIADVISNEENEYHIDAEDLEENTTDFCHALMNIMPAHIVGELTDSGGNLLESNHLANRLCFQYINMKESDTKNKNNAEN